LIENGCANEIKTLKLGTKTESEIDTETETKSETKNKTDSDLFHLLYKVSKKRLGFF
jgi:hypothetical protein